MTQANSILETYVDFGWSLFYPFALRAAVLLKVPTIIQAAGPEAALSAKEICAHLPNPERASSETLEKILEILTCHDMLKSTVDETVETGKKVKKYGLTPLSRELAGDDSLGADWLLFMTAPEFMKMWPSIHEAVLNPEEAVFNREYGKGAWQYMKEDVPKFGEFHVEIMKKISVKQTEAVVDYYDEEFRNFTGTLVDVGGSEGATAAILASKYPNIKCVVNFDLPDVVKGAPAYPRVEHVGGSFLDFVPQGDMLFLKFVLLNWNDEQLVKLLRNCFKALPAKGGKIIMVEKVEPDEVQEESRPARLRMAAQSLGTSLVFMGAKLRTLREHQVAAEAAGFSNFRIGKSVDTLTFMEAEKAPIIAS
ncbi:unnamed protein product [Calypogeia fissa]